MFNIGPGEFLVLAIVAVIVLGPERLPALARDAARMLRTLRELATGARTQLREELGPEFADLDLSEFRNLNPRTALQRAILGDEDGDLRSELRGLDPRALAREVFTEDDEQDEPAAGPVSMDKPATRTPPTELPESAATPYDAEAT